MLAEQNTDHNCFLQDNEARQQAWMPAVTQSAKLSSSDYVQTVPEQNNLIMAAMMETSEANTQGKYQENGPWSREFYRIFQLLVVCNCCFILF